MTEAHETHLHILVCMDRINAAWNTLKQIQSAPDHPLVGPAFRYALVEYATAFTRSDSPSKKRRTLPITLVPVSQSELHQRLIDARNSIHAHADLTVLEAQLTVHVVAGEKQVGVSQNFIHGLEELNNLPRLISLVEGVLRNLYVEHKQSERRIAA